MGGAVKTAALKFRNHVVEARHIRSGYIWIAGASGHFKGLPFGGFKKSGTGREEGLDELLSYTEEKAINIMMP